ncbi:MAG TPA: ROK family protein [Aggregatilineales bacterium]|nr:ROK family protein [Anaerolineales bacterium]HRE46464.1 ROK family protein [Aggregatilineales bacterium]
MTLKQRTTGERDSRRANRQAILRAIYSGEANTRVDLATHLGVTKTTVGEVIGSLIDEGYLAETGLGQSTDEGGKRPRLLEFQRETRHVIGVSLNGDHLLGVLSNMGGDVLVEHRLATEALSGKEMIEAICNVINGLIAQISVPLLAIGIGVPGLVNSDAGVVELAPTLTWRNLPLTKMIEERYGVPVYIGSSTALAALGLYAWGSGEAVRSLAMIHVGNSVGVGWVIDGNSYQGGIGYLRVGGSDTPYLDALLGWTAVRRRAEDLYLQRRDDLMGAEWSYLHVRRAYLDGQAGALTLHEELASSLGRAVAWTVAMLRPEHLVLAGTIADLGQPFLRRTLAHAHDLVLPDLLKEVTVSLNTTPALGAVGAVAEALRRELGII